MLILSRLTIPLLLVLLFSVTSTAQPAPDSAQRSIQDNSFLLEEAYNQEFGVVQHISSFTRFWNSKDWVYSFTQEWPMPGDPRHQFSYTMGLASSGAFRSGPGVSDLMLNYRYQLLGSGDARVAFSPRVSLLVPSGDARLGRGAGGFGLQSNLPLSLVLNRKLVTHWNLGGTVVPNAQNAAGERAKALGYNLGQSFIWLAHPRFNVLLETVLTGSQAVVAPGRALWSNSLYLSPGVRWAWNFKSGLQIVPGIAMPVGAGPSAGEKGIFLYLSFEHPFRALTRR